MSLSMPAAADGLNCLTQGACGLHTVGLTHQQLLQFLRDFDDWAGDFLGYKSPWFLAYVICPELGERCIP